MLQKSVLVTFLVIFFCTSAKAQDPLDQYIKRLRKSEASGGSETAFLSVGSTFLYGQNYFEKKEYDLANMYFKQAYEKDSNNAFVNYQIAASLLKQNNKYKSEEARKYLEHAFRLNSALRTTFENDFPREKQKNDVTANDISSTNANDKPAVKGLSAYLQDLRYSQANGGAKTSMNSPGLDVLYAYGYYEKGEMELASMRFRQAVTKAADDPYANYLLGVSLAAQGLNQEAGPYLDKAYAGDAALKQQYASDIASASAAYKKFKDSKKINPAPVTKVVYGGKLIFGNYNCTETVWNGPNANPPYSYPSKGYFELKANGTYRWLDNGMTGKYSYNEKTGEIKWLSGYLSNMKAKTSLFKNGVTAAQITVNFSTDYRWECGCDKK